MRVYNISEALIDSVYSFIYKDGPDVEYDKRLFTDKEPERGVRRPRQEELDVIYFPQMWGSTALGFGGMGGACMTHAYTTVIRFHGNAYVYFGGRFCYACEDSDDFRTMVANHSVPGKVSSNFGKLKLIKE